MFDRKECGGRTIDHHIEKHGEQSRAQRDRQSIRVVLPPVHGFAEKGENCDREEQQHKWNRADLPVGRDVMVVVMRLVNFGHGVSQFG